VREVGRCEARGGGWVVGHVLGRGDSGLEKTGLGVGGWGLCRRVGRGEMVWGGLGIGGGRR